MSRLGIPSGSWNIILHMQRYLGGGQIAAEPVQTNRQWLTTSKVHTCLRGCSVQYIFNPKLKSTTRALLAVFTELFAVKRAVCGHTVQRRPISGWRRRDRTTPWCIRTWTVHYRQRSAVTVNQVRWAVHAVLDARLKLKWHGNADTI